MHNNRLRLRVILIVGLGVTGIQAQTTVKDNDGNVYKTVSIGTQVGWQKTYKLQRITIVLPYQKYPVLLLEKVTTGAYCNYKNDQSTWQHMDDCTIGMQ